MDSALARRASFNTNYGSRPLTRATQARTVGITCGITAHLVDTHPGPDARIVEDVENVLIVDVEKAHLHVVVEHGPGHGVGVIDRTERLQQLLVEAVVEDEIPGVDDDDDVGMPDAEAFVLAESGQALWSELAFD